MNCSEIQKLLSNYLDESITDNIKEIIDNHLKTCPACRHELEILHKLSATLDMVDDIQSGDDFEKRVIKQINMAEGARQDRPYLFSPFKRWALITAAAVTIIIIVFFGNRAGCKLYGKYGEKHVETRIKIIEIYDYRICYDIPDTYSPILGFNSLHGGVQ